MFTWIFTKFKNFGVSKAIAALDNLEVPLGQKIDASIKEFGQLNGYGISVMVIDELQDLLRAYFKIEAPKKQGEEKI